MSNKLSLQLAEQCESLVHLLEEIDPTLKVGEVNIKALTDTATSLRQAVGGIKESQSHLVSQRTDRTKHIRTAQEHLIAMRDTVRGVYGANSAAYERSGRTPTSKRSRNTAPKK